MKNLSLEASKELLVIPAGEFIMGITEEDDKCYYGFGTCHSVKISRDFLVAQYQVTQQLWCRVMGSNPSIYVGDDVPVQTICWFDAVNFCNKLSEQDGFLLAYTIEDTDGKKVH